MTMNSTYALAKNSDDVLRDKYVLSARRVFNIRPRGIDAESRLRQVRFFTTMESEAFARLELT